MKSILKMLVVVLLIAQSFAFQPTSFNPKIIALNIDKTLSSKSMLQISPLNRKIFLFDSRTTRSSHIHSSNVENTDIINISELSTQPLLKRTSGYINLLYKFSRPHTIKGTILASIMGVSRAILDNPNKVSLALIPQATLGLLALLCGNAYIVGINQIYDVDLDEINKPYLPIAAKMLSPFRAWLIISICLVSGIGIVASTFSHVILRLYIMGIILGTMYSVPPIQLKRMHVFAGATIAFVRGFLLNFGVYYAVREAFGVSFKWNPVVTFISVFMTIFASVIAITKDLQDVEGDKKYHINTLALRVGVSNVANIASWVLIVSYVTAMSLPRVYPQSFNVLPMSLGHLAALLYTMYISRQLNPSDVNSVKKYYKSIWNLFYFEYLLYPLI